MSNTSMESILGKLKAAQDRRLAGEGESATQEVKFQTIGEGLEAEFADINKRADVFHRFIEGELVQRQKLITTPDLINMRFGTLSDYMPVRANRQTTFLNLLRSKGAPKIATDYQFLFNEEDIGAQTVQVWGVDQALPSEVAAHINRRSNTLTCIGNVINVSMIAQEMASQQVDVNVLQNQIALQMVRMEDKMNRILLSNVEIKFEGVNNVPQLGGFVTRSVLYGVDAGGSDLTRPLIQGRITAMANAGSIQGLNYNRKWLAFCGDRQLQVLRDIIIAEYGGIYPTDRVAFEKELIGNYGESGVRIDSVFDAHPGGAIPFAYEPHLPTGSALIFDADQPNLVKMRLGGQLGPFIIERPTEQLQFKNVVFDLFTLEDPLQDSRSLISNLAS